MRNFYSWLGRCAIAAALFMPALAASGGTSPPCETVLPPSGASREKAAPQTRLAQAELGAPELPPEAQGKAPEGRRAHRMGEEHTARSHADGAELPQGAGRYSVLREGGRDTGCMITLDSPAKPGLMARASLSPGCRDQGIVIFDPARWQMAGSHLVLTARKGHKAIFDLEPDGSWKKDPAGGKPLSLKRL